MKTLLKLSFLGLLTILLFNGCKKDQSKSSTGPAPVQTVTTGSIPDGMVMTPQGLLPKASVHLIENGYHLELRGNHMVKVETATGTLKEDFGAIIVETPAQPQAPAPGSSKTAAGAPSKYVNNRSLTDPPGFPGWMTYAQLGAPGTEMNTINSTWTAPAAPTTQTTQLIYIGEAFSSLAYNTGTPVIIETVLQWGSNGATGYPTCWVASNWCTWNGGAAYTTPTASGAIVAGTTSMNGIITLNGLQTDGSYNYTAQFNGISNALTVIEGNTTNLTGGPIPKIPLEPYAYEVLEAYCLSCTLAGNDYPNQQYVQMNAVSVTTGLPGTTPSLTWSGTSNGTTNAVLGEHTVVSNSSPSTGVVQLWFRKVSPSIYFPSGPLPPVGGYPNYPYYPCATLDVCLVNTGGAATYSMTSTGTGLSINPTTGCITGTPAQTQTCTVTATNDGIPSTSTTQVTITVETSPTISYPASLTYNQSSTAITPVSPTTAGLTPSGYAISGGAAAFHTATGLTFNTTTGVISGPPNVPLAPTSYTVTASYSGTTCTSTATINLIINMAFSVYNYISPGGTPPSEYYGALSISFKYSTSPYTQYGAAVVYSTSYPGAPYPYIFWLPPGNYTVVINPGYYQFPTNVSFIFSGGPSWYGSPGGTWTNLNISPTGSTYLKAHD